MVIKLVTIIKSFLTKKKHLGESNQSRNRQVIQHILFDIPRAILCEKWKNLLHVLLCNYYLNFLCFLSKNNRYRAFLVKPTHSNRISDCGGGSTRKPPER